VRPSEAGAERAAWQFLLIFIVVCSYLPVVYLDYGGEAASGRPGKVAIARPSEAGAERRNGRAGGRARRRAGGLARRRLCDLARRGRSGGAGGLARWRLCDQARRGQSGGTAERAGWQFFLLIFIFICSYLPVVYLDYGGEAASGRPGEAAAERSGGGRGEVVSIVIFPISLVGNNEEPRREDVSVY